MGRNSDFRFKQFTVNQQESAMKVGTDGVLLGAWTQVNRAKHILDIGTGTGLISLMMAQRTNARITGIEIDERAAGEALRNVLDSPWADRISIKNCSFQDFLSLPIKLFDLIVTNPPFFTNSQRSKCASLAIAKHNHLLPLTLLATGVASLLAPKGTLSLILPSDSADEFIYLAGIEGLKLHRQTIVRPDNIKKPHRHLLEFSKTDRDYCLTRLNIHLDDHSDYTEAYKALTRDFYLHF